MDPKQVHNPNRYSAFSKTVKSRNPFKEEEASSWRKGSMFTTPDSGGQEDGRCDRSGDTRRALVPGKAEDAVRAEITARRRIILQDSISKLRDEVAKNIEAEDPAMNSHIDTLYNLIRTSGSVYLEAKMNELEPTGIVPDELVSVEGLNSGDCYSDLIELGRKVFGDNTPVMSPEHGITFAVKYPVVSHLQGLGCDSCATGAIEELISVRTYTSVPTAERLSVNMHETTVRSNSFNTDFINAIKETQPGKDQMCRALRLNKFEAASLDGSGLLLNAMRKALGADRTTRCAKLVGLLMWLLDRGQPVEITISGARVEAYEYSASTIGTIVKNTRGQRNGVMYLPTTDPKSMAIASLALMEFPLCDMTVQGRHCYWGGFSIPSEVGKDSTIYIIGPDSRVGDSKSQVGTSERIIVPSTIVLTAKDVYDTICTYARGTGCQDDFRLAVSLMHTLYVSEGLTNFSFPKSQGVADLFAPCYVSTGSKVLPPMRSCKYLILGALALVKQSILMIKDMSNYFNNGIHKDDLADCTAQKAVRDRFYATYRDWYFTDAFNLCVHFDPMRLIEANELNIMARIDYMSVYWSVVRVKKVLRHTFLHCAYAGSWNTVNKLGDLTPNAQLELAGTYVTLGCQVEDDNTTPYVDTVYVDEIVDTDRYKHLARALMPGLIRTLPAEVTPIPKLCTPTDFSEAVPVTLEPEVRERKVIVGTTRNRVTKEGEPKGPKIVKGARKADETVIREATPVSRSDIQQLSKEASTARPANKEYAIKTYPYLDDHLPLEEWVRRFLVVGPVNSSEMVLPTSLQEQYNARLREYETMGEPAAILLAYPYLSPDMSDDDRRKSKRKVGGLPAVVISKITSKQREIYDSMTNAGVVDVTREKTDIPEMPKFFDEFDSHEAFGRDIMALNSSTTRLAHARVPDVIRKYMKVDDLSSRTLPVTCAVWRAITGIDMRKKHEFMWRRMLGTILHDKAVLKTIGKISDYRSKGGNEHKMACVLHKVFGMVPEVLDVGWIAKAQTPDRVISERLQMLAKLAKYAGIKISVAYGEGQRMYCHEVRAQDYSAVRVSDDGIGITDGQLALISSVVEAGKMLKAEEMEALKTWQESKRLDGN